jgi:hypothetical protein
MGSTGATTHLAGGHKVVAFQGGKMLADGHTGQVQCGRKLLHGATGAALEQREDLALSVLYRHHLGLGETTTAMELAGVSHR